MSQTQQKNKISNDNSEFYVPPTDRLDVLYALTKAQARESKLSAAARAKGEKYEKLFEQVDLLVMVALSGHRNNKTGQCDPSHALIADEIGVSVSTVQRSFERLKAAGFISTLKKFFKGAKTSSQVDINWQKGEQWITKADDDQSRVTGPSVTGDGSDRSRVTGRSVMGDGSDKARVTDKHSAVTQGREHGEQNSGAPACGKRGPAGGLTADGVAQPKQVANDNNRQDDTDSRSSQGQPVKRESWPLDMAQRFMDAYPKGGNIARIRKELAKIEREGRTDYRDILRGATNYKREKAGVEPRYISEPENFLRDGLHEGYQKDHRPKPKCNVAI